MSTKPKKVTKSILNKYDAQLNAKKTVYILDGTHAVQVSQYFRDTQIKQLTIEYIEYVNELKNRPDVTAETIMAVPYLLYGLTAKFFTDLPVEYESIDELVAITKQLMDLGIVEVLYSGNGFEPSQIDKLNKEFVNFQKNIGQAIGEMAIKDALNSVTTTEEVTEDEVDGE